MRRCSLLRLPAGYFFTAPCRLAGKVLVMNTGSQHWQRILLSWRSSIAWGNSPGQNIVFVVTEMKTPFTWSERLAKASAPSLGDLRETSDTARIARIGMTTRSKRENRIDFRFRNLIIARQRVTSKSFHALQMVLQGVMIYFSRTQFRSLVVVSFFFEFSGVRRSFDFCRHGSCVFLHDPQLFMLAHEA